MYPEPHVYNPARFLDQQGNIDPTAEAPETRIFGSGRRYECLTFHLPTICLSILRDRVCPGRHFAVRMLCLTFARVLAAFDILPPVDDEGRPRIPEARYHNSVIRWVTSIQGRIGLTGNCVYRHAMPFECVVKPRSENAVRLMYDAITIH